MKTSYTYSRKQLTRAKHVYNLYPKVHGDGNVPDFKSSRITNR